MFTYAEAEQMLATLSNAALYQEGPFRARMKQLKKLGVPLGVNPGRGKKILYDKEYIYQWAVCLELLQFGIDPSKLVPVIKRDWRRLANWINSAPCKLGKKRAEDVFLYFTPKSMSMSWEEKGAEVIERMLVVTHDELQQQLSNPHFHRAGILNISEMKRHLLAKAREFGKADFISPRPVDIGG